MKKTVKWMILLAALAGLAGTAGTLAWFTDTETAANVITTGNVKIALYENEEKITNETRNRIDSGCLPGQPIEKRVMVVNEGINDAYVRVSIENESGLKLSDLGESWSEYQGYYYYTTVLRASAKTSDMITYVAVPEEWTGVESGRELNVVIHAQAIQSDHQNVADPVHPTVEELEAVFGDREILPAVPEETEPETRPEPEPEKPADYLDHVMGWFQEQLETPGSAAAAALEKVDESIDSTGPNYGAEIARVLQAAGLEGLEGSNNWQMRKEADGSCTIYWVDGIDINHNEAGDIVRATRYNTKTGLSETSLDMIIYSKLVLDQENVPHTVNYLVPYEAGLEEQAGVLWLAKNMIANETLKQYFGTTGLRTMDSCGPNFGKPVSAALTADTGLSENDFIWKIVKPAANQACDFYWADVNVEECREGQWVPAVHYHGFTGVMRKGQCQITADGNGKKLGAFKMES